MGILLLQLTPWPITGMPDISDLISNIPQQPPPITGTSNLLSLLKTSKQNALPVTGI
eukprot:CAMPEP_0172488612 /NCGR_PEP_ID=MMETSP1066-20121228/18229_1 /TAXON_ID=671091 /ORGANISM="Coscinodiscus wailesii, Strain CCMP2513" /LENGTH=56 /DNA_ID=CAMNT_0013255939 /DNA_START=39 /DNA_END=209 /DNA_ORIENTATION=-